MPAGSGSLGLRLFETRAATLVVSTLIAVHAFAFFAFHPSGVTVADEGTYLRQAQLILSGSTSIERVDPFSGEVRDFHPVSRYPLGTAILLLPFVAIGGREAASLLGLLCTLAGVGVTARWLYEQGRSPLWCLLVLLYPPTIVLSRVAMSEAPSLLVVALGLWLYGRGLVRGRAWLFGAGVAAGVSFAFREANVLLFAPLFLGSVLRRDRGWPGLLAGGVVGLGVRGASAWLFFGDPFFTKPPDHFSLEALPATLPLYLLALLVFVPGGLVAALAYRGPRWPELVATVLIFVGFHAAYGYSGEPSGWVKRLVLGPRYFVPLLPLLALAAAEVWPRWGRWLRARSGLRARSLDALAGGLTLSAVAAAFVAVVALQWAHGAWAAEQAIVRAAILDATPRGGVVVTNWVATGKFIDLVGDDRIVLRRRGLGRAHVARLLAEGRSFHVVFLDRSDSDYWRREAFENELFVNSLGPAAELVADVEVAEGERLRVWRVTDPSGP